jgi:hydroxyacid-oxoacid transhydrogenase
MLSETVFTFAATTLKVGRGAVEEVGWDLKALGVTRVLLVTDRSLVRAGHADRVCDAIQRAGVDVVPYRETRIEPDLASLRHAVAAARSAGPDGYVSLGGGSCIDTAKVANLLISNSGEIEDYINRPLGGGRPADAPLHPHIAIPTTSGTGAESTTVAAVELPAHRVKAGISDPSLRPVQAIIDADLTATLPAAVAAASGLDVICHAAESYTSLPFDRRRRAASPSERPPYQGANPLSDIWAEHALALGGRYLRRAVRSADDADARAAMLLAAATAGVGFGTAGVHIPHACSYPVAGLRHDYVPEGYETTHPFVPHGQAVAVTAPAAFRFTYSACPERHERVAQLISGDESASGPEALPRALAGLMRDVGVPLCLRDLGYAESDVEDLAVATLQQERLVSGSPRELSLDGARLILSAALDRPSVFDDSRAEEATELSNDAA